MVLADLCRNVTAHVADGHENMPSIIRLSQDYTFGLTSAPGRELDSGAELCRVFLNRKKND
jgi:hypothetical protein